MTKRLTIHSMIVDDLGYCCEAQFFRLYKQTALVAARLGVTTRAVKYHKARVVSGECTCENKANCMKGKEPKKLLMYWRQEQKFQQS